MKVLFVNTNENYGGAARAAYRIMRGVKQKGVEVQMFVRNIGSRSSNVVSIWDFVPKHPFYKAYHWLEDKVKSRWQHHKWRPYRQTKQDVFLSDLRSTPCHGAFQKLDYDIVHLHWINNRFIDINELKKIKKPIVWTLHDSWPFTGICHVPYDCKKYEAHCGACPLLGSDTERDYAYEVFEKKIRAYKDLNLHIVTPSTWLGDCAKRSALFGRFPVMVIPNCIDADVFKPLNKRDLRIKIGLDPDKKYLLFGAVHVMSDANKGFAYLKESMLRLQSKDVELLVYGDMDDVPEYGLPLPVHTLGFIAKEEQMAQLCNAADVTIVPSLSENLSSTIMESLSCGTPVVAFQIGGNSDMVDHKQNGYLAEERNSEDLARGIKWCLENNADGALSKKAREKVMNNYTIDIVSEQYKQLYESL